MDLESKLSEDIVDFIQQALRTVALEYSASLFFVSTLSPITIENLRSYCLHRLFNTESSSHFTGDIFPFHSKPNVLQKELFLIPSGWDSVGKIQLLREAYTCETYLAPDAIISNLLITDFMNLVPPPALKKDVIERITLPENEQDFLAKQANVMNTIAEPSTPIVDSKKIHPKMDHPEDVSQKIARLLVSLN
jgi:dynein light intermediate chain 1